MRHNIKVRYFKYFKLKTLTFEEILEAAPIEYTDILGRGLRTREITIRDVKDLIQEKHDIPIYQQVILYEGGKVSDGEELFDMYLVKNSLDYLLTLNLVVDPSEKERNPHLEY